MEPMEQAEGEEPKTSVRTVTFMGKTYSKDAFLCRLFYLSFFASFGSLFPLLAVYFKQLGMTSTQVWKEDSLYSSKLCASRRYSPKHILAIKITYNILICWIYLGYMIVIGVRVGKGDIGQVEMQYIS